MKSVDPRRLLIQWNRIDTSENAGTLTPAAAAFVATIEET